MPINDKMVSMRDTKQLLTSEPYIRYNEKKQAIKSKYPKWIHRTREENREYMRELGELIWDVNGDFQEFIDTQIPMDEEIRREKKVNPKKAGRTRVDSR